MSKASLYTVPMVILAVGGLITHALAAAEPADQAQAAPPGADKSTKTQTLEAGAAALQTDDPLEAMNVYIAGFHPMKEDPSHQMEAHHFCNQVNQDFAQCALFDGNTDKANLTGIEYIISETLFEELPEEEKQYWHPHNYEVLSGQLVAPGLPSVAEKPLMQEKLNSYGKTWHVWMTTKGSGESGDKLPFGEAMLAWSFNRDGEAKPGLVERMEERLDLNVEEKRRERQEFVPLAKPQEGVDALKDDFPKSKPIPGVMDKQTSKDQK